MGGEWGLGGEEISRAGLSADTQTREGDTQPPKCNEHFLEFGIVSRRPLSGDRARLEVKCTGVAASAGTWTWPDPSFQIRAND